MADSSATSTPQLASSDSSPAAYERLLSRIMAVEGDLHINVDVMYVVTLIIGHLPRVLALRDQLLAKLSDFQAAWLDDIDDLTRALQHAHGLYVQATKSPSALQALVERAEQLRDVLHADAIALATRGLVNAESFREVKRNNGHRALIVDLQVLVATFRERWTTISDRTAVRAEELDSAVALIDTLTEAVGTKEHSPAAQQQAIMIRAKAFTLVVRIWDEIRAGVVYLRRSHGDADDIAPSAYSNRSNGKRSREETEESKAEGDKAEGDRAAPAQDTGETSAASLDLSAAVAQQGAFKRQGAET